MQSALVFSAVKYAAMKCAMQDKVHAKSNYDETISATRCVKGNITSQELVEVRSKADSCGQDNEQHEC